jgi:hypothetical protein
MPAHPIVHVELSATDPAKSSAFYGDVFGWKIVHDARFDYYMFDAEGGPGGGFVKPGNEMYKEGDVVCYIETDDIDATLKKIESLGGKTLAPKMEIPDTGWMAFFADPGGNRMGLYTAMRKQS